MGSTSDLFEIVVRAAAADAQGAREFGEELLSEGEADPAFQARVLAMLAFTEFSDADYAEAVVISERALAVARTDGGFEPTIYALAMRLLASTGTMWAGAAADVDHFANVWELRERLSELEPSSRVLAGHLLVEGVLSTGRMLEAMELLEMMEGASALRPEHERARHPHLPFLQLQSARVLYFQGRIEEALPIVESVVSQAREAGDVLWESLAQGYLGMIAAHQLENEKARQYIAVAISPFPEPRGYLGAAVYALAAYAHVAIGDTVRATELAVLAGGDEDLSRLQIGDRALVFELLVTDALTRDDLATAQEWGGRSLSIAAHPAAAPIVEQLLARIDLARGEGASSAERAAVAAARARLTGRYLDAARSDLLRARALAASGLSESAVRELTSFVRDTSGRGMYYFSSAGSAELRRLGRRSRPLRGRGWAALSERERQIAVLAAEGFTNKVIGSTLFLSERTVQSHLSRVLAALGVTSRAALPSRVVQNRLGRPQDDLAPLSPRQRQVAELIARGATNQMISVELSIAVKTVEKHVGEIFLRWDLTTRTGVANAVLAESDRAQSAEEQRKAEEQKKVTPEAARGGSGESGGIQQ